MPAPKDQSENTPACTNAEIIAFRDDTFCKVESAINVCFPSCHRAEERGSHLPQDEGETGTPVPGSENIFWPQQAHGTSPCVGWFLTVKVIGAVGQGWPLVSHCCPVGHAT